jgi:acetyltransferase-like isoleucine patch superfamily enzyme
MALIQQYAQRIFTRCEIIRFRMRSFFVAFFCNVQIGANNRIYPSTKFRTNEGGKIDIGRNNEFLFGVCLMTYGGKIVIGNNCSINPYTVIYGHGRGVTIGDNVLIAAHCLIIPSNHNFESTVLPINQQGHTSRGIIIKDNVWIGAGCQILDGVTIETGAIIGAGSVVKTDVPMNSIFVGVAAKQKKIR